MNTNLRNFAIWVVIVLSIVALVNLFQSNQMSGRRASEISYSELLAGVDSGAITEVEIRGHRINGVYREKGTTFTTIAPDDPGLIDRLNKMLSDLCGLAEFAGHVFHADLRGTLSSDILGEAYKADWVNELHPEPPGFEKLAQRLVDDYLVKQLPALR